MNLRQRIASSRRGNEAVAGLFRAVLTWIYRTSRVEADGWDDVADLIRTHGAVIFVSWHQRIMLTPWMFDQSVGSCRSLTSTGRTGRLMGVFHRSFGFETMPMPKDGPGAAETRVVLKGLRDGVSIGIAPDGTRGPRRKAKIVPIQWARAAQVPIVVCAYSASRFWTMKTWDRFMFPKPYGKITMLWRQWDREIPRRLAEGEPEALALELEVYLDAVTAEADRRVGHAEPQL